MTCKFCAHPWEDHRPTGEEWEGLQLWTCECEDCDSWVELTEDGWQQVMMVEWGQG